MLSRLFIAALWLPAGKGLTSWHFFAIFPCGILGQMWYLIVSFPVFFAVFLTFMYINVYLPITRTTDNLKYKTSNN